MCNLPPVVLKLMLAVTGGTVFYSLQCFCSIASWLADACSGMACQICDLLATAFRTSTLKLDPQQACAGQVNMQQRERGVLGKECAKQQQQHLEIVFPTNQCLVAGQIITCRLPAAFAPETCQEQNLAVQVGPDTVDEFVRHGQDCAICLDVTAPHGTEKQPIAIQISQQQGDNVLKVQLELAG